MREARWRERGEQDRERGAGNEGGKETAVRIMKDTMRYSGDIYVFSFLIGILKADCFEPKARIWLNAAVQNMLAFDT